MLRYLLYLQREWRKSKKYVEKPVHNSAIFMGRESSKNCNPPYSLLGARMLFILLVSDFKLSHIKHKLARIGFRVAYMSSPVEDSLP